MSKIQALLNDANEVAETSGIDMNEAVKGGGGGRLLPEGYAFAQLVEYIDLGNQPQEFGGKPKEPAPEFSLGFALTGHGYSNDDGSPYIVRPYSIALSRNEKARAFLLFKLLNWKGDKKNFAQLLSQKWLVKVVHAEKSKNDKTIVSRLDLTSFLPPLDPVTKAPYPIPDAPEEMYRVFLWDKPNLAAWDELFIEGTFEAKDGKPAASKNRVQETILGALNFSGSPLELLLAQAGKLPAKAPASPATPVVQAQATQVAPVPAAPAVAVPAAPVAAVAVPAVAVPQIAVPAVPVLPA